MGPLEACTLYHRSHQQLGPRDVIHKGDHINHHLGFYPKLEIIKKRLKLKIFYDMHVEYEKKNVVCQCFDAEYFRSYYYQDVSASALAFIS